MSERVDPHGCDILGRSLSVMLHDEADLHSGYVWRASDRISVNAAESISYIIEPAGIADSQITKNNWFVWDVFSQGSVLVQTYKGPDQITGGDYLGLQNCIICSEDSPILKIKGGVTVGSDGALIHTKESGSAKNPIPIPEQEEWQCKQLKVHVKITNLDNSAQNITTNFRIAEHQ